MSESKESTATSKMVLKKIEHKLSVCKVTDISDIDLNTDFYFIGKTDEGLSLVCKTDAVSTYNTDYILVKEENFDRAMEALISEGYTVV